MKEDTLQVKISVQVDLQTRLLIYEKLKQNAGYVDILQLSVGKD